MRVYFVNFDMENNYDGAKVCVDDDEYFFTGTGETGNSIGTRSVTKSNYYLEFSTEYGTGHHRVPKDIHGFCSSFCMNK